jgi:putative ABC transport system substrate-binding protein
MKRRAFIALLGAIATDFPFPARAQPGKTPTIGFLGSSTPSAWSQFVSAFVQGLSDLGWIEGKTIAIEYRWADGREERYPEIAAEFVRLKVDVILTVGSAVRAVKQVTANIPTVFAVATDPLGGGLVQSLARPGANVTGSSIQSPDLSGKRVEILREAFPGFRALAIMANAHYAGAVSEMNEMEVISRAVGLKVIKLEIQRAEDIAPAIEAAKGGADALYACGDSLVNANRTRIITLAHAARIPTMHYEREYVAHGGLMSYGPNYPDLFRRAAKFVDKILRGTKPGDIPVEQPTKFELVINLKTAKALGINVPPSLLARADEVIE